MRLRRPPARAGLLAALLCLGPGLEAQETHVLIVSGLGGDAEYRERFVEWGLQMVEAAEAAGVPGDRVRFLAEDPEIRPGRIHARSTREEIESSIGELARTAGPEDRVLIILIGHGGGAGPESRVSMPGRSLRASEYALLLEQLAPRTVAFVNLASGSGDFIPIISGEGRIVVTATRSSRQRNAAIFGGYFVEAFAGEGSDVDRDGRISVLEAFEYARQETERFYNDRGLIASETALIEDRLEGTGTDAPLGETGVGQLASRFFLQSAIPTEIVGEGETAGRLRTLYSEQARLEDEVALLRQREDSMTPEAYRSALETLLVRLAETGSQIRELEEN